jgi:signal transduction histidine kinase
MKPFAEIRKALHEPGGGGRRPPVGFNIHLMDESADHSMSPVGSDGQSDVRASTLGQLGAQVAHDFNNILAVALTSIEMAMRISDPVKANVFLGNALKVIGRGRMLTDRLAAASYACESPALVDVHELISQLREGEGDERSQLLARLDAARAIVKCDAEFLEQALRNVLANANEAMKGEGTPTVSTRNVRGNEIRAEADRDYLVVSIKDSGGGISEDARNHAFELFYTTKAAESGRGIGLAQAKDTVRRAGGVASIESSAADGTTVTLAIPLAQDID